MIVEIAQLVLAEALLSPIRQLQQWSFSPGPRGSISLFITLYSLHSTYETPHFENAGGWTHPLQSSGVSNAKLTRSTFQDHTYL